MFDPILAESAVLVLTGSFAVWLSYRWRKTKRRLRQSRRRLVAYEGKLRSMGHNPNRVFHDFENYLDNDASNSAEEFDVQSTQEEK